MIDTQHRDQNSSSIDNMMTTADLIGIFGVICYQIAYAGLQLGFLHREDRRYLVLNLFGPCCLLYSLLFHFNLAAAVSQVLWLVWSCLGIRKIVQTKRELAVAAIGDAGDVAGLGAPAANADLLAEQPLMPATEVIHAPAHPTIHEETQA
ncbi:CBU_0592 family membrane protein [Paraburkholderia bannensis]|uniref:CBU_0592 family membrane protein n=1 Tax=Paraburkholderia bannensis TaxID=765414 RepID=UPI002ABD9E11|nr:hypothetical protein [Paraburkholderia bannensis]